VDRLSPPPPVCNEKREREREIEREKERERERKRERAWIGERERAITQTGEIYQRFSAVIEFFAVDIACSNEEASNVCST
jgi:hypothetical protein